MRILTSGLWVVRYANINLCSSSYHLTFVQIFELATNEPLFPIGTFGLSAEQIDREHSRLIEQIFGNDGQTNERFTKHLEDRLPPDFGIKNIQRLSWLLLSMLQISPEKRMSAAQLLDHIFLEGVPKS